MAISVNFGSTISSLHANFQLPENEHQQWPSFCTAYCELKTLSAWFCILYWFFSNMIWLWSWPCLKPEIGLGQPKLFCICTMHLERNLMMQGKKTNLTSDSLEIKATQWDRRKSTTSKIPVSHIEPITVAEYLILHVLLCRKQCTLSPEGQREMRTSVSPI